MRKTASFETGQSLWMHFLYLYLEIRDKTHNDHRFPHFPRKYRHQACAKTAARLSLDIHHDPRVHGRRELGGHPARKDRGECKCGLEANALRRRCTWGI